MFCFVIYIGSPQEISCVGVVLLSTLEAHREYHVRGDVLEAHRKYHVWGDDGLLPG